MSGVVHAVRVSEDDDNLLITVCGMVCWPDQPGFARTVQDQRIAVDENYDNVTCKKCRSFIGSAT